MPPARRRALSVVAAAAVVVAFVSTAGGPAGAHTEVLRSSPPPAARVGGIVDHVELTFLDPVLADVALSVTGPDGAVVDGLGEPSLSDDGRSARVDFPPLRVEGPYVVTYAFTAADGDRQEESYRFQFVPGVEDGDPADGGTPIGEPADDDGVGVAAVVAALAVVVALVGGLGWRRHRSRSTHRT